MFILLKEKYCFINFYFIAFFNTFKNRVYIFYSSDSIPSSSKVKFVLGIPFFLNLFIAITFEKNMNMKKIICLFLLSFFVWNADAQTTANAVWLRHTCGYTDGTSLLGGNVWGDAVCADAFGNSYNSGSFMGFWFTMDTVIDMNINRFYINKYNSNGKRIWTAKAKGTTINSIMTTAKMLCDSVGNVYLCGTFSVDDSVYLSPNWYPVGGGYIAKYDSSGNNIWCRYVSRSGTAGISFTDMSLANGKLYACGNANYGKVIFGSDTFNVSTSQNGFITKLDLNGNILQSELLDTNCTNELFGIVASKYTDNIYLVGQQLGASNIVVDGISVPLVLEATNSIVIKMNSSLVAQWMKGGVTHQNPTATWGSGTKSLSRIGIDKFDNIYAIANGNGDSTRFGSLGFHHLVNGGYVQDVYTIKLNSNGIEQWLRYGKSAENDYVRDIIVDENGNSVISVYSGSNALGNFYFETDSIQQWHGGLVKYDPNGNLIYVKQLQEARSIKSLALGIDSSFYATGNGISYGMPYDGLNISGCEDTANGSLADFKMVMVKFFDNTSLISTSIKEIQPSINAILFPNPATDFVDIKIDSKDFVPTQLSLFDMLGNRMVFKKLTPGNNKIDISQFSAGMYFYSIQNQNNQSIQGKLMVIKTN